MIVEVLLAESFLQQLTTWFRVSWSRYKGYHISMYNLIKDCFNFHMYSKSFKTLSLHQQRTYWDFNYRNHAASFKLISFLSKQNTPINLTLHLHRAGQLKYAQIHIVSFASCFPKRNDLIQWIIFNPVSRANQIDKLPGHSTASIHLQFAWF